MRRHSDLASRASVGQRLRRERASAELLVEPLEPRILLSADLSAATLLGVHKPHPVVLLTEPSPIHVSTAMASTPAALDTLSAPAAAAEHWIGGASGSWDTAGNWSGGVVPDQTVDVTIAGATTVSLGSDAAKTVTLSGGVTLQGGMVTVSDGATLDGTNTLSGASLSANGGTIANVGTLLLGGSNNATITGPLDNAGTITLTGAGNLVLATAGGTLTDSNQAGGVIDLQSTGGIQSTGGSGLSLNNAGTIEKSLGAGTAAIELALSNSGAIAVTAGTLALTGGDLTSLAGSSLTVAAGAVADLTGGGAQTYGGILTATGAGTIALSGGELDVGASGLTLDAAAGLLQWTGGAIQATGSTLTNAGAITLSGADLQYFAGTLDNAGTIDQDSAGFELYYPTYSTNYSGALSNSGLYSILNDSGIGGSGPITNAGRFDKSAGSGDSTINVGFDNDGGTIDVAAGTLTLTSGVETGGTFQTAKAATLLLTGPYYDDFSFSGTLTGVGPGTVEFDNVRWDVGGSGATFDFAPGELKLVDGQILATSGTFTNEGAIAWSNDPDDTPPSIEVSGTIVNAGVIDLDGSLSLDAGYGPGTLENTHGAALSLAGGSAIAGGTLVNDGALAVSGTGTTALSSGTVDLDKDGSVVVNGGTLDLSSDGTRDGQSFQLATGAALVLSGGTYTGTQTSTGAGTVDFTGGTVGAGGATFAFAPGILSWTTGSIDARLGSLTNKGDLILSGTDTKVFGGGTLVNTGNITQSGGSLELVLETYAANFGGTLDNSGSYTILDDGGIVDGTIFNTGSVAKTGGTGTSTISSDLDGAGTLSILSGSVIVTGNLNLEGATLADLSGTLTLGYGTIGDTTFVTTTSSDDTRTEIDLTEPVTFSGIETGTGTGTVVLAVGQTYTAGPSGATLDFAGGGLVFQGGLLDGGPAGLTNEGLLTVSQVSTESQLANALINDGTLAIAGVSAFELRADSLLTNTPKGIIDFQGDGAIYAFGAGGQITLVNEGVIRKSAGTTSSFEPGGYDGAGGSFDAVTGTLVIGNTTDEGGYLAIAGTLTGTGSIAIAGQLAATSAGATLDFVSAGGADWTGGDISGGSTIGGTVTNAGTLTLTGTAQHEFGGTIDNTGSIVQQGGYLGLDGQTGIGLPNTVLNNSGLYDLQGDGVVTNNYEIGALFDNTGTLTRSAGADTGSVDPNEFASTGLVSVSAGTLDIATNGEVASNTLSGGSWEASNGATLDLGAIETNNATIVLDGAGSTLTDLSGLSSNAGRLDVTGGATLTTTGDLANTGTLTVGPSSTVTVGGDFSQAAGGTLATVIDGTPASHAYGTLAVTGTASLGGTFEAALATGFGPTSGDVYQPVSFASATGAFAAVTLPAALKATVEAQHVSLAVTSSGPDLVTTGVTSTATSAAPGAALTVDYTVTNTGGSTAAGSWTDSVYLSLSPTMDSSAVLLGRVVHTGDLAAGGSYAGQLTAALPPLLDGPYYILVLSDSRDAVPDPDRADNLGASSATVAVATPVITLGETLVSTIASGQDAYYRIAAEPGADLSLAATFAAAGNAQVYVGVGTLPTPSAFDQTDATAGAAQAFTLPRIASGDVYVLVHGLAGGGTGSAFSLTASTAQLSITSLDSSFGGRNETSALLGITGTQFTASTTLSLVAADGTVYAASGVSDIGPNALSGTFDLSKVPIGQYTVTINDGTQTARSTTIFSVLSENYSTDVSPLVVSISTPGQVLVGSAITAVATIRNPTDTPILVSDFWIFGTNVTDADQQLIAPSDAVVIPAHGSIERSSPMQFMPAPDGPGTDVGFQGVFMEPGDTPLDLKALSAALKPATVSQAAWDAIFQNFTAEIGTTQLSLYSAELKDQTLLQIDEGVATPPSSTDAVALELLDASDVLPTPVLDAATDVAVSAPGIPLTFSRSFQASIEGRYTDGRLGQGWVDNWDDTATLDATDKVVLIEQGTLTRQFAINADGSFTAGAGDTGTLTQAAGAYRLTEADGAVTQFNADGTLDYVQDADGNRVTAGYSGGDMTSLTSSDGDKLILDYNANGTIASVTDPSGRVATYNYDSAGTLLTSVTTVSGTSAYGYGPDTTGPAAYELTSVSDPGGTNVFLSYDAQGRLAGEAANGDADAVTYTYGDDTYQVTDAAGHTTGYYFNQSGQIFATIDPLGRIALGSFNSVGEITSLGEVGGGASTVSYATTTTSASITDTDPTGGASTISYAPGDGEITGVTDQDGNPTLYGYDASGSVSSITYADGTMVHLGYAADGQVTQTVDRSGSVTTYVYDPHGLLLSETLPGGATTSYTYDQHGDMLTATDASGTITLSYDGAGRLTRVVYPDGRFLAYSYDAGGRCTQVIDQDGSATNYSYDSLGRLTGLTDASGAMVATYTYNELGQLVRQDNGNGTYTTKSYDADGEILSIVNYASDGTVNSRFDYTYDELGRVATMTTLAGTATYGYDADGRLASATLADGTGITYRYDAAGNRTAVIENGVATTYTSNELDEYITVGGDTQTYDADGDLTAGSGATYSYDALGRLVSVSSAAGTWSYQYDALGDLSSETHDGVQTSFLVDPTGLGNVFAEYSASGQLIANYTYGYGLTSRVASTGTDFYDFDALGSTVGLTGASGTYVASYSYDPSGNLTSSTGTIDNPFQFEGALGVQNDGSGLLYMRARSYDPTTGRFTQVDPLGDTVGTNNYTFATNDPVAFVDPTGLAPVDGFEDTAVDFEGAFAQAQQLTPQAADDTYAGVQQVIQSLSAEPMIEQAEFNLAYYGNMTGAQIASIPDVEEFGLGLRTNWFYDTLTGYADAIAANGGQLADALEPVEVAAVQEVENDPAAGIATITALTNVIKFGGPLGAAISLGLTLGTIGGNALYELDVKEDFFGTSSTLVVGGPHDPNFISGPAGYGDSNFVTGDALGTYYLAFTNEPTAGAPARTVTVTEQLDPNLDLSTFAIGSFGFGDQTFNVPAGLQDYSTRIDDRAQTGVFVDVTIALDVKTRTLTATYTSIDPATLDDEADPFTGFLPPDKDDPMGTGWLTYTVAPEANLTTGTRLTAQASVVFDTNAPVVTEAYVNTIDNDPPSSRVSALPAISSPAIALTWSGTDGAGSGIASYDLFVSEDGGSYRPLLTNTTQTSTIFEGSFGHTYSFYTTAKDNVGQVEAPPAEPEATTYVDDAPVASNVTGSVSNDGPAITIAASYTDPDAGDTHSFTIDTAGTKGKVTNNGDGTFTYNPNGAFDSLTRGQHATDSFTYTVTDAAGLSSTGTATITVVGADTAPVASNVIGSVSNDGPPITISASYTDPDQGDTHSFTIDTAGTKGKVTNNGNGTFTYNPDGAFDSLTRGQHATDSFTYTVTDAAGLSSTGTATITVVGADTAPVASNVTGSVSNDGPPITISASYTDPDQGDTHSFTIDTAGTKGKVTNNGNGTFTYNPEGAFDSLKPGQQATDSFTYTVTDAAGLSSTATATITVLGPAAAAPTAYADGPYDVDAGRTLTVDAHAGVLANDGAGAMTASLVSGPSHGTLSLAANGSFTYTPNVGYVGPDQFTYAANDGVAASKPVPVSIDVTPATVDSLTVRLATDGYRGTPRVAVGIETAPGGGAVTFDLSFYSGKGEDVSIVGSVVPNATALSVAFVDGLVPGLASRDIQSPTVPATDQPLLAAILDRTSDLDVQTTLQAADFPIGPASGSLLALQNWAADGSDAILEELSRMVMV